MIIVSDDRRNSFGFAACFFGFAASIDIEMKRADRSMIEDKLFFMKF